MFAGIVHNQAKVASRKKRGNHMRFKFQFQKPERKLNTGQSVAVNGVCLTATQATPRYFFADVVRETLKSTGLGKLQEGDFVNIERSLRVGDEIGGHYVTGHVDGQGKIIDIEKQKKNYLISIKAPQHILPYIAMKGSVSLDGISLTVQDVYRDIFTITIIPHTMKVTTLKARKVGHFVNLEIDLVARYLMAFQKALPKSKKPSKKLLKKLKKQGF